LLNLKSNKKVNLGSQIGRLSSHPKRSE